MSQDHALYGAGIAMAAPMAMANHILNARRTISCNGRPWSWLFYTEGGFVARGYHSHNLKESSKRVKNDRDELDKHHKDRDSESCLGGIRG